VFAPPEAVVRTVRYATAYDADGDFNGREACAPPRGADGVVGDVAEDVDGAIDAQDS
jgi:hypothetical protein